MVVRITNLDGVESLQFIVSAIKLDDGSIVLINMFHEEFKIEEYPNNHTNPDWNELMKRFMGCNLNGLELWQREDGTYYV